MTRIIGNILAIVSLAIASTAALAAERWVFMGGTEPLIRGMRVFPNTPVAGQSVAYAASLGAGVFRIVDNGSFIAATSINNGLPLLRIRQIAGTAENNLYVAVDTWGVYKSTNSGASWAPASGSGGTGIGCLNIRNLNVQSATAIWAVTACDHNSGVYRTADSGATWTRLGAGTIPDNVIANSIATFGTGGTTTVIVSTSRNGMYRSNDNGTTWTQTNNGISAPDGANVLSVFSSTFLATANDVLAYVEGQGVYRTTDGGANWAPFGTGLPTPTYALAGLSRENATTLYLGLDKGPVYKTTDSGATWTAWGVTGSDMDLSYVRLVTPDTSSAGKYYLLNLNGLRYTRNGGTTFSSVDLPMEGGLGGASIAPNGSTVYALVHTVFKIPDVYAPDDDESWAFPIDTGLPGTTQGGFLYADKTAPSTIYLSLLNHGLFKTVNDGASWANLNLPNFRPGDAPFVEFDPTNTQVVYAAMTNKYLTATGGGLSKSTNGGSTWNAANVGLANADARAIRSIAVNEANPSLVLIGTGDGIYQSTTAGASWTNVLSFVDDLGVTLPVYSVRFDPSNSAVAYAATYHLDSNNVLRGTSGVYKSTNSGGSWTRVFSGQRTARVRVELNGRVVVGAERDASQPAVFASTDGGTSWAPFNMGIGHNDNTLLVQKFNAAGGKVAIASMTNGFYLLLPIKADRDFTADGKSDLLWLNAADGSIQGWLMDGLTATQTAGLLPAGGGYSVTHLADLNGDGKDDMLIRGGDGSVIGWLMNGLSVSGTGTLASAGSGWSVMKTGDFNADAKTDLIWQHTDGTVQGWLMDGLGPTSSATWVPAGSGWSVSQVVDLNGDAQSDLIWQHTNGTVQAWIMNGLNVTSIASYVPAGTGWSVVLTGDFNGDGKGDLFWQHTGGATQAWLMDGLVITGIASFTPAGTGWSPKLAGDLDGDLKADIFWEHTSGASQTWLMDGLTVTSLASFVPGGTGWVATHLLDFNADGKRDVVWKHTSGGTQAWLMNGLTITQIGSFTGAGSYSMVPTP